MSAPLLGSPSPFCIPAVEYGWQGGPAITRSMPSGKEGLSSSGVVQLTLKGMRLSHPSTAVGGSCAGNRLCSLASLCPVAW